VAHIKADLQYRSKSDANRNAFARSGIEKLRAEAASLTRYFQANSIAIASKQGTQPFDRRLGRAVQRLRSIEIIGSA
jgi:hypothetical protein